jgi:DNA (cytosine-5)-methyltransferase 1
VFGPVTLDAAAFGAATSRPRLFVIGMHREYSDPIDTRDIERVRRAPSTVKAAIADLEGATFVGERDGLDWWRISRAGRPSSYASLLRSPDGLFTGHRSTTHSNAVIQRFRRLKAGDVDPVGRHAKLDWRGLCPTLRAGTGADRGSFQSVRPIHPLEPRVITVREAARLQGFPDSHIFHPTIWHSFRMIGNSVSPIIAEALFSAIREKITEA